MVKNTSYPAKCPGLYVADSQRSLPGKPAKRPHTPKGNRVCEWLNEEELLLAS
jgi:hypothetical protein